MKNHFARTGIAHTVADDELEEALARAGITGEGTELSADLGAAREILHEPRQRTQYRRMHLQYRALAEALDVLDHPDAADSHRWHERLVEFAPETRPEPSDETRPASRSDGNHSGA